MHENENQGFQTENEFVPIIFSSTTPAHCHHLRLLVHPPPPRTPITTNTPSNVQSPSLERMQPDVELPGPTEIPQTPSPGFAIKERRAANMNRIKDYKLPESVYCVKYIDAWSTLAILSAIFLLLANVI